MADRPNPPFPYQARQWAVDGAWVECFSGRDPSDVIHEGRIIGMTEAPTVRVQKDDGQIISWVLGITRKKADDLPVSSSTEPHPSADWLAGWEAACTDFDEWANWRWEICHALNASKQLLDAYSWASNHALVLRGDWTRAEVLREKRERGEPSVSGSDGTQGAGDGQAVCCLRPEGHSGRHTNQVGWTEPASSSDAPNETPVEEVADSELRDRIAQAGIAKFREYTGTSAGQNMWNVDVEKTFRIVAEAQSAVVAPVLAAAIQQRDEALADVAQITSAKNAIAGELRIEESNAEFSDRALHLVLGCCDPSVPENEDCQGRARRVYDAVRTGWTVPFHWPTVSRERDRERAARETFQLIVNEAGEALRKIADQNPWEQPPSLMDRIELVADRLREARAERDELRAHGVARDEVNVVSGSASTAEEER